MARKAYTERKPFTNPTTYTVGKGINTGGKTYIVTAIVRVTDKQYKIYGLESGSPMKLGDFVHQQKQREAGQVNVYLAGGHILNVTIQ